MCKVSVSSGSLNFTRIVPGKAGISAKRMLGMRHSEPPHTCRAARSVRFNLGEGHLSQNLRWREVTRKHGIGRATYFTSGELSRAGERP
jgi:hypothetical protein